MTDTTSEQHPQHPQHPQETSTKTLFTTIAVLIVALALLASIRSPLASLIPKTSLRSMSTNLKITPRPWSARGHADHDWLYTFHTFAFASYQPRSFQSYGPLRVLNEDRVKPSTGFGAHPHAEFLIWSYVVNGTLEHKDSLGNLEYLKRGDVQFTSAGTGIRHSEYNRNPKDEVHFLQIWAKPNIRGLKPHYVTRTFPDEAKRDKLARIMESTDRVGESGRGEGTGPIGLQADVSMSASILSPGKKVVHEIVAEGSRKIFLHVVMKGRTQPKEGGARIRVGDVVIGEGDGAYVDGAKGPGSIEVESVGEKEAEFLLFDLGMENA